MKALVRLLLSLFLVSVWTPPAAAEKPDWHCCDYACANPNAPADGFLAYFCHPTSECPSIPSDERSSSVFCELIPPGVKVDTCQECVNDNH